MYKKVEEIIGWALSHPGYLTATLFFVWGFITSLFSVSGDNLFLNLLYFLLMHVLLAAMFYCSFKKNRKGRRSFGGLALTILALVLTLFLDWLALISL